MKIGLYTISALLFIIATSIAAYMINPGTYSFEAFGINMPKLPIAVWFAAPVALLALFSIAHISYYGTKIFFANKKWKNDAKKIEEALYWSLIKEPTSLKFNHDELKNSASLLSKSQLNIEDIDSIELTPRLKEAAKTIKEIYSGKYIDLKKIKFTKHLSKNNEITLQNQLNQLEADSSFALKVIDTKDNYDNTFVNKALDSIVKTQDFYTLKKYAKELGKDRFMLLLNRAQNEDNIGFSLDMLKSFISHYKLDCKDYYKVAESCVTKLNPDETLSLFKELSEKNENAQSAYLFLLFKYEMVDKAKDILDEFAEHEYKAYRALYTLKKAKHNYKLADFINADNACK